MKRVIGPAAAASLALWATCAAAQTAGPQDDSGPGALLLAARVGAVSPAVSAAHKAVLARYLAGNGRSDARAGKITVSADRVACATSAADVTAFACDLTFGASTVHVAGRAASQVLAALDLTASEATGTNAYIVSATQLACTLDAAVIAGGNSGGADCTFTAAIPATPASAAPPAQIATRDSPALLLATLVGGSSRTLSAADKAALAHYLAGDPKNDAGLAGFTVDATQAQCTASNRDEVVWSCSLSFGAVAAITLTGGPASEVYAALGLAGIQGDAAMGTFYKGAKPLRCTLNPAAIAAGTPGGVTCTLSESEP